MTPICYVLGNSGLRQFAHTFSSSSSEKVTNRYICDASLAGRVHSVELKAFKQEKYSWYSRGWYFVQKTPAMLGLGPARLTTSPKLVGSTLRPYICYDKTTMKRQWDKTYQRINHIQGFTFVNNKLLFLANSWMHNNIHVLYPSLFIILA